MKRTVIVLAIGVVAGIVGFQAAKRAFLADPGLDPAAIDARLQQEDIALFGFMRAEMPADYAVLLDRLSEHIAQHGQEGLSEAAFAATAAIRSQNADTAAQAPDRALRTVLETQRKVMVTLDARHGPETCAPFAVGGGSAVPEIVLRELALFDTAASAVFRAIVAGRDTPVERAEADEADWRRLVEAAVAAGLPPDDVALMANPDPANPGLCRVAIAFLDAVIAADGAWGERLRAAVVRSIMGPQTG